MADDITAARANDKQNVIICCCERYYTYCSQNNARGIMKYKVHFIHKVSKKSATGPTEHSCTEMCIPDIYCKNDKPSNGKWLYYIKQFHQKERKQMLLFSLCDD